MNIPECVLLEYFSLPHEQRLSDAVSDQSWHGTVHSVLKLLRP